MTQDSFERATVGGLIAFAASVGLLGLVGMVLALMQLAAETAQVLKAAGPAGLGIGITISLRKGGK
ncbi:hypothetical protein AB4Z54_00310 [Streptomyces sp. MCAF7]